MSEQGLPRHMGSPLYFEDLHVGQRFVSREHALDADQIVAFARQFDPQPFHVDPEAARQTFFRSLVASGWHTAAISMRLLVECGLSISGGLIGAGGELSWPRPTYPDAVLHVECEVIELRRMRSKADRAIATIRSETHNQHGEIVQVFIGRVVVPLREP